MNILLLMSSPRSHITLVEVLVVIVILAVLTVSLSAKIGSYFDKPKELKVLNDMSYVRDAVILANGTNGLKSYGAITDAETLSETTEVAKLAADLNSVLDPSLKITAASRKFTTAAEDPWNKAYKIGFVGAGAGGDNGDLIGITITSGGADGAIDANTVDGDGDDYDDYVMTISLGANGVLGVDYGKNLPGQ